MSDLFIHPEVQWLADSVVEQGGKVVVCNYDPEGGQLNQGRLYMEAKIDGKRVFNSGWGKPLDGKFQFWMKTSGPVSSGDKAQ